ncbi:MAG: hypothetical protein IJS65_08995 [Clostridia bacterium]|nr:hypothetical protein [Clostridia bacterium]
MKKRSNYFKIALSVFAVVFLLFLIIKTTKSFDDKLSVIDATLVTVEDKLTTDAVFIRSESLLKGKSGDAEYLVHNGEKVSADQSVCIFFDSPSAMQTYAKLSEVNNSISALKYTDSIVSGANDTAKLDRIIYEQLKELDVNCDYSSAQKTDKSFYTLTELVSARNEGSYNSLETNKKISLLENEAAKYKTQLSGTSNVVRAAKSGYFMVNSDGFENVFSPACIKTLDPADLENRKNSKETVASEVVGTLIDDFNWYFAIETNKEQAAFLTRKMETGAQLKVYFPGVSTDPIDAYVYKINRGTGDRSVVVFRCGVMSAEFLSPRFETAEIVLSTVSGIKIPREALHQKDGLWGVYCIDGPENKFKPARILYQTEGYYLLEMAESSSKGLFIYDKIITSSGGIR